MRTLSKRDIILRIEKLNNEKLNNNEGEIDELVDADGSIIDGADNGHNDVEVRAKPTTDEYFKSASQGPGYLNRYGSTQYSRGVYVREEDEVIEIDEVAKAKIEKMVEDILNKRNEPTDIVNKTKKSNDVLHKKTFKELVNDALKKYDDESDTEIYRFLIKLKNNL